MKQWFTYKKAALPAGLLLLIACGEKELGHGSPEAAAQYEELTTGYQVLKSEELTEEILGDSAEVSELIAHFNRTADAGYATPKSGITMLHLACLFKKPELARCLLLDGANPNARTTDPYGEKAHSPLSYAISPVIFEGDSDEEIIQLVDILINGGANPKGVICYDKGLMSTAAYVCENEAVARHLLQYAGGITADDIALIIERGWADLLGDILEPKNALTPAEKECIVCAGYIIKGHYDAQVNIRMVELFLSKGCDINTTFEGSTVLLEAAAHLSYAEDAEFRSKWVDFIAYLLSKGADITTVAGAESAHAGLCAYDLLANRPGVLEALAERGHKLAAPPIEMREGTELVDDLARAGIRRMNAVEAQPHLQKIASIFTPTAEQMACSNFDAALLSAAEILCRVDQNYAAEVINNSSLWALVPRIHQHTHDDEPHHHVSAATLIYILRDVNGICIDRNKILQVIKQAEQIRDHDLAAHAVELLGRDPGAAPIVTELLESPDIAIRAGAWGAKLQLAGLPRSTNGEVKNWLAAHGREADTQPLRTALLATSLDEMWFGHMSPERKAELIQALRDIGAPESAIIVYGEYADNMDNPDKLDELEALGKEWSYELEIATARFIFQHADDFLAPNQQK